MNCISFQNLTPLEKSEFVGRLVIAVQSSEMIFDEAAQLINKAATIGIYKRQDVVFTNTLNDNENG
jgi:hypothetical protein